MPRGYFGIGIYVPKRDENIGTLWRSAYQLGASFVFTIGTPPRRRQASDTTDTSRHIPLYNYETFEAFISAFPKGCHLAGIEMGGRNLATYTHAEQSIYLLGREDTGLPSKVIEKCNSLIEIPSVRVPSFNVAVAGSIVMYDRLYKTKRWENE